MDFFKIKTDRCVLNTWMCLKITKIKTEDQKVSATTESHNWGPGRRLGLSPAEIKFEEQKKKNKKNYEKYFKK